MISYESNKYALHQNPAKPLKLTKNKLELSLGILFTMSVAKMLGIRSYWKQGARFDKIAEVMSKNRFEQIKRFLHCNDNPKLHNGTSDKLFKVRSIIDLLIRNFSQFVPSEYLCIDEKMVPFKGS